MKFPHLPPILLMTYVFTTSVTCWNPFWKDNEILYECVKQNKAVQTHTHNGGIPISDFNFNIFGTNYIESQYQLFVTIDACRSYNSSTYHVFDIKQTLRELKKVMIGGNYLEISSFIEGSPHKQKDITYHEKTWVICSFFGHFFSLMCRFSESYFYNFTGLFSLTAFLIVKFISFFKRRKIQSVKLLFDDVITKKNEKIMINIHKPK